MDLFSDLIKTVLSQADSSQVIKYGSIILSITLLPTLLLICSSFTRIYILLSFIKYGLSLPIEATNKFILIVSLIITTQSMQPTIKEIHEKAIKPLIEKKINFSDFYQLSTNSLYYFMKKQNSISQQKNPLSTNEENFTNTLLIFLTNETQSALLSGIFLLIPFLLIDLIVGLSLSSIGIFQLNSYTLSLPLKCLLFISIDGWTLFIKDISQAYGG